MTVGVEKYSLYTILVADIRYFLIIIVLLLTGLSLTGCTSVSPADSDETTKVSGTSETSEAVEGTLRDNTPVILLPTADGTASIGNDIITVDISNTSQGYIMASYHGNSPKVNIQVTGPDGVTYLYFISEQNIYTGIPLSSGDGAYYIDIYENVEGEVYSSILNEEFEVTLENEFLPFLYSNQFVYFTEETKAIQKGAELAEGCTSELDVITAIYNYVVGNTEYDYDKAKNVTSPYYPDVDETMESHKGICFDYSALMCTMLRTQRIPSKLNIGYADGIYHAWISVYIESIGWVDNIIEFNGTDWTMMDPTFASTDGSDYEPDMDNYILMFQR